VFIEKVLPLYYPYWNTRLTVLAYHRIVSDQEFLSGKAGVAVSTSVSEFARQMRLIKTHFSPISIEILQQWQHDQVSLPPRPLLVTFDDGYQDIETQALPILEKLGIPATVFLASDYMGSQRMFQWDMAAYCFTETILLEAELPLLGYCTWRSEQQRQQVLKKWLAASKLCKDTERQEMTQALAKILQVSLPSENKGVTSFLSWEQVRHLSTKLFTFGSHTCTHPILSKIPLEQVISEVQQSKQKIEQETGREVWSFAYPNGLATDFNAEIVAVLATSGYQLAFSLLPGPTLLTEIKQKPLEICRVTITAKDSQWRFMLKLMGMVRFKSRLKA